MPRAHLLPILPALAPSFLDLPRVGEYVLSTATKKGKVPQGAGHISPTTLANWAQQAAEGIEGFQLKRIRSGIETALAAQGVSKEIRGHLQSHGLTGVQAKHYDAHDYLSQKRVVLQTVAAILDGIGPGASDPR